MATSLMSFQSSVVMFQIAVVLKQLSLSLLACVQISAAFSGGSAVAVLVGGVLFCRYTGAGRRNFITGLTVLASVCFFALTK